MKRVSHLLPLLIALLLAGLTLWLRFAVVASAPAESTEKSDDPDAVAENLTIRRLDMAGKPNYVLQARRMTHYPADDSTQMDAPRFEKSGQGPTLTVSADHGTLTHDGDDAYLYGNVLLVQDATADSDELRVRTDYLHIIPERDIVRTDKPVTMTEGGSVISGSGMELNKKTRRLSVFGRVKGSFEQRHK